MIKNHFAASIILLGALCGGCNTHETVSPPADQAFIFATEADYFAAFERVVNVSESEYLQYEAQQGIQTFAGAYYRLLNELMQAQSREELVAGIHANPSLVYLQGDEVLPVVRPTAEGRLASPAGYYTIGEYVYRQHKGIVARTTHDNREKLAALEVENNQLLNPIEGVEVVRQIPRPLIIQEEAPACNTDLTKTASITNGQSGNKGRKITLTIESASFYHDSNTRKHVIMVTTFPQYRLWGIWLNGATNIYVENNFGNIRTWEGGYRGPAPAYIWYPAQLVNRSYALADTEDLNSKGYTRTHTLWYMEDGALPTTHENEMYWNSRNIRCRTTGTNNQYVNLDCI